MIMIPLSQAIRLGSLLVQNPGVGVDSGCAIRMAVMATGDVEPDSIARSGYLFGLPVYDALLDRWPWLNCARRLCPKCDRKLIGSEIIYHVFDIHVMARRMTIDQLADWVATIEPKEINNGEPREKTSDPGVHAEALHG